MKKALIFFAVTALMAQVLTGCGSAASNASSNAGMQAGSGGQRQISRADLSGQVATVNGEDVTIKVIKMPDFTAGNNRGGGNLNNSQQNNGQQGGQSNSLKNGNAQQGSGQGNNSNQQGQRGIGRTTQFTGETKTITLTSDIKITQMVFSNNVRATKNLKVSDLKQGDTIQIWYADKDKGTISRVSVMAPSQNFGNRSSGNQNNSSDQNNTSSQSNSSSTSN